MRADGLKKGLQVILIIFPALESGSVYLSLNLADAIRMDEGLNELERQRRLKPANRQAPEDNFN